MKSSFERLGPYKVIGIAGQGGMGTVYKGVHDESQQLAAIKVLAPVLAADISFRERFVAEIESLKKLQQSNIVEFYGNGEEAGHLFYAMELVDGQSLQDELKRGRRFNWREVIEISIQVCAALKHAHDHGIIHRDLKPANLLLDDKGHVKLLDFGIAKLFGATNLTTNTVLGTADFMAPEQAEGKTSGPKTDLYSLGCVMYTLLAGRPPFTGKSVPEVVHKVRFEEPIPLSRLNPETPAALDKLVDKLLQKSPENRIPTAVALSHRLKAVEYDLSVHRSTDDTLEDSGELVVYSGSKNLTAAKISDRPTIAISQNSAQGDDESGNVPAEKRTHFETVEEAKSKEAPARNLAAQVGKIAGVFVVLALFAFTAYQITRPPSADRLYEKIQERIDHSDPKTYLKAKSDVERFIQFHPNDDRISELKEIQEKSKLVQLQRKLDVKVLTRRVVSSPVERLYLEAISGLPVGEESALARLQAIVDLHSIGYESDAGQAESEEDQRFVELAREKISQLEKSIKEKSEIDKEFVTTRMEYANSIESDSPDRATRIYRGIIELFGDKTWAGDQVSAAHQRLVELEKEPTETTAEE